MEHFLKYLTIGLRKLFRIFQILIVGKSEICELNSLKKYLSAYLLTKHLFTAILEFMFIRGSTQTFRSHASNILDQISMKGAIGYI